MGRLVVPLRLVAVAWLLEAALLFVWAIGPRMLHDPDPMVALVKVFQYGMLLLTAGRAVAIVVGAAIAASPRTLPVIAAACGGVDLFVQLYFVLDGHGVEFDQIEWVGEIANLSADLLVLGWVVFLLRPTRKSPALLYVGGALIVGAAAMGAIARAIPNGDFLEALWIVLPLAYGGAALVCGLAVWLATTRPRDAGLYPAPFTPPAWPPG